MTRKKWTPQDGSSAQVHAQRDKRKWQIAFRRYVMLESPCSYYAPFFALDAPNLRKWIETQFTGAQTWATFSQTWQFEHRVPVALFNFEQEADLKLCWHFTNIRVEALENGKKPAVLTDLLATQRYYQALYQQTQLPVCAPMLQKIEALGQDNDTGTDLLAGFITQNKEYLLQITGLGSYQYDQLNEGVSLQAILNEQKLMGG
jgi:hypothetical protein